MAKFHIIIGKLHLKLTNNSLRGIWAYQSFVKSIISISYTQSPKSVIIRIFVLFWQKNQRTFLVLACPG